MKFRFAIILLSILILSTACQTIKNKTDEVVEKENKKYGLFVGEDVNKMRLELGAPNEDIFNESGNEILIYKTKKYGVPCERRFEVNSAGTIIAFNSSGCF
ncbi:hypothetical protein IDG52_02580 [Pelagibacterales bacterium SAG-MED23]|nr:hypothetical protein [Pelagibacterales bacterium SAG-MED23]